MQNKLLERESNVKILMYVVITLARAILTFVFWVFSLISFHGLV